MGRGHWAENTSHSIFRTRFSGVNVAKLGTFLMLRSILEYRLEGLLVPLGSRETLEGPLQECSDKQPTSECGVSTLHQPWGGEGHVVTMQTAFWVSGAGDDVIWNRWVNGPDYRLFALPSGPQQGQEKLHPQLKMIRILGKIYKVQDGPAQTPLRRKGRWWIM